MKKNEKEKKKSKMPSVSACKKVQIFKWLLKKHGCTVVFERQFWWEDPKTKTEKIWFAVPKLFKDGKDFMLHVVSKEFPAKILSVPLPSKMAALSYADVLDALLAEVKRTESDCYLVPTSWPYHGEEIFLLKDATLEGLCIEFDLAWRDAFECPSSPSSAGA